MLWFGVHFPRLGLEIFERRAPDRTASPAVLVEDGRVRLANVPAHARVRGSVRMRHTTIMCRAEFA